MPPLSGVLGCGAVGISAGFRIAPYMIDEVRSTKLPNGITVLTEHMPGLRSVTAGIWVRRGSRHETPKQNGICHFIEHSVFKGTQRRTARDIAVESDRLGGNLDAFTTHEMTGFAVKVADRSLPEAFDLLADLPAHPRFDQNDLDREQNVILEEMKMVEDTPDELLGELFNAAYFPDHPLGRPIEGTRETISSFDHDTISAFHRSAFTPANLVVAGAGNIEHERLVALVESSFDSSSAKSEAAGMNSAMEQAPTPAAPILIEQKKELEQAHLVDCRAVAGCSQQRTICREPVGFGHRWRYIKSIVADNSRRARAGLFGWRRRQHVLRRWCFHNLCRDFSGTCRRSGGLVFGRDAARSG